MSFKISFRETHKYTRMIVGFFLMAVGVVSILQADLGMPPWDVFHLGLHPYLPLTYGQIIQGVGLVAIVASYFLGVKPKLGTFLNMIFVGLFVDFVMAMEVIPQFQEWWWRGIQLMVGIFIFAYGTMTYIMVERGTGPRDSLMMAFSRITGYGIGAVRTVMEVTVTITGFLLSGPLGVGTVIFALTVGTFMELCMKIIRWHNRLLYKKWVG